MKDLETKKNEDLENIRKKIDELFGYVWARGYKCGQADRKEQAKENPGFYIGDVVYYSKSLYTDKKGIIIGLSNAEKIEDIEFPKGGFASVYTREFDIPQIVPLKNLTPTGEHVNVLDFFNKAFIDIQEVKKNDRS